MPNDPDPNVSQSKLPSRLLLATRNAGKALEVSEMLGPLGIEVSTLADHPDWFSEHDPEETGDTFVANALIKARSAALISRMPTIADDSGLEVDALGGRPGVRSARYAGEQGNDAANNRKLIAELADTPTLARTARFRCALVLFVPDSATNGPLDIIRSARPGAVELATADGRPVRLTDGVAVAWMGTLEGRIIDEPRGDNGFGYDPHFLLPHCGETTAELSSDQKNTLSHRGQAVRQMVRWFRHLGES